MTSFDASGAPEGSGAVGGVTSSDVSGVRSGDAASADGAGVLEQLVRVLAHPGLLVVAGHVVPLDAVVVEVVEDADAALLAGALVVLAVVGLSLAAAAGV